MKLLISIILCLNIMLAEENSNIVKTSELELFLFKIGFESLLKDVDTTKSKATLNEEELKKLNSKIEIIMNEIYKDKRVLQSDNNTVQITNSSNNNEELKLLKKEIELLKIQMNEFKNIKVNNTVEIVEKTTDEIKKTNKAKIKVELANLRDKPTSSSNIVDVLVKGDLLEIESCDRFSWCKIKGERKYISKFLLEL